MDNERDIELVPWVWEPDSIRFHCELCPLKDASMRDMVLHVLAVHPC